MASKSLIGLFRDVNPELLKRKDRVIISESKTLGENSQHRNEELYPCSIWASKG